MGTTEQLVVELPSDLIAAVRQEVRSGAFASESEAIEALLRSWFGSESPQEPEIETLRAFVAEGIAEADDGQTVDADSVHAEMRARIASIANRRG
jgi:antitoxin ParD1/3/4